MRTLVISDLHLGGRLHHDVLMRPAARGRLLDAIDSVDRLVLLGDIVELIEGNPEHAMIVAEPVLRALGERLGEARGISAFRKPRRPARRGWARARGSQLTPDSSVPLDATPALVRVSSWLAPAVVHVQYPGVWLSETVWATHGHYLDRHLLPESAFGIARGLLGRLPRGRAAPSDYEHLRRPSVARASRWMPQPLAKLVDDIAELGRASTMPGVRRRLLHRRWRHSSRCCSARR